MMPSGGQHYSVGQTVKLRSGRIATITRILQRGSLAHQTAYQVRLLDTRLLIGVEGLQLMCLAGPQTIAITPQQSVLVKPRLGGEMPFTWPAKIKFGFFDAWARLTKTISILRQYRNGNNLPVILQDICFCAFKCPVDAESYRRLFGYVLDSLEALHAGLVKVDSPSSQPLVIADVAIDVPISPEGDSGKTLGGYVPANAFEVISIWWSGDNHRTTSSVRNMCPLVGEIHLNLPVLTCNQWRLTQTLIHEATHKFIRTVDHIYLPEKLLTNIVPAELAQLMGKPRFEIFLDILPSSLW